MKQQDKVFMVIGGLAVTVVATIGGVYLFSSKDSSNTPASTQTQPTQSTQNTSTSAEAASSSSTTSTTTTTNPTTATTSSSSGYKDGTYSATANYYVPHGTNSITTTVTITDGKITSVNTSHNYSDRESSVYIDSFDSSIKGAVVGQKIDGLSLSRIGGASLTTNGFNEAISTIINDAKA